MTDTEAKKYRRDGFAVVRGLLTAAELEVLRGESVSLLRGHRGAIEEADTGPLHESPAAGEPHGLGHEDCRHVAGTLQRLPDPQLAMKGAIEITRLPATSNDGHIVDPGVRSQPASRKRRGIDERLQGRSGAAPGARPVDLSIDGICRICGADHGHDVATADLDHHDGDVA